jgi:DNA invertase Pin-like site-specific DNA recombinase
MGITGIYVRTSVETDGTSIDQQKKEGIKFCKKNKFEYQFYEDEGKSGFKIEDDENPFKNRQGLTKLITDIENKIIDKVWVYEHSRFSRNQYGSFVLFRIFEKYKITVYEKDKKFDMNDPQSQMIRGILDSISQYERHLIVGRTTRGLHDSINRGIRGYREFYGYKKDGKTDDGYVKWVQIKSEIENIKYSYKRMLEGSTVKIILLELYKNKKITENERSVLTKKWTRILRHFENTGYSFNTDGLQIFNKFKRCEIESLRELNNQKYYVKSLTYPEKLVSIEDWIKVVEKLQVHKIIYKEKMRRTDTELLTGIIKCPYCESRYYLYSNHYTSHGKEYNYRYYKHTFYGKGSCKNTKSLDIEKTNEMFEVFFFYFYLVYDDTKTLIEESQRVLKINQMELREKTQSIEIENRKIQKQIDRFQSIYEKSEDTELLKLTLVKETELKMKKGKNEDNLNKHKLELEELNKKYNHDELELTYYNVKETVINFFENMTVEEQRTSIIRIVKDCQIFNKYIVIDTGKILFIFDTEDDIYLTTETYNEFKKDKKFKDNFLHSSELLDKDGKIKMEITKFSMEVFKNINKDIQAKNETGVNDLWNKIDNYFFVRRLGDIRITSYNLESSKIDMKLIMEKRLEKLGIDYKISGIEKIVFMTSLSWE